MYRAKNRTLGKVDQKFLDGIEMWCLRRMEKNSSTDPVRNEEVLLRVNEERKANWVVHILAGNAF